jgi:hypothetical protein
MEIQQFIQAAKKEKREVAFPNSQLLASKRLPL